MDADAPAGRAVTAIVSVRDLSWMAGSTSILDGVALEVAPGELVALMGRNGAGKSTLMDLVAGLRRAPRGSVLLDGRTPSAFAHLLLFAVTAIIFGSGALIYRARAPRVLEEL